MEHAPVIFLDTNVFHYLRLYLGLAEDLRLRPVGKSPKDTGLAIKKKCKGRARADFIKGRDTLNYLCRRCKDGARVVYAPITCLELMYGLLRGRAIVSLAKEGAPQRMWSRVDEDEILARLLPADYAVAQDAAGKCEATCAALGLPMVKADPESMRDVWALAENIVGHVFMQVEDSVVFASALLESADELLTGDHYLRKIASYIGNPGGAPYGQRTYYGHLKKQIARLVADTTGERPLHVAFPKLPARGAIK
ncbi:MAG TPA: hypothetical protein VM238_11430 [Phycisphaerae bacterium]|nr:hypothetical protein [Phycisphaerae bacterium]